MRFLNGKDVKRVITRAVTCGLLLILPSCAIPPLRQADPMPVVPPSFNGRASAENVSQLTIEQFFNDPNLTDVICQALAFNRELRTLNEEVQIAWNEYWARTGAYLPFAGFRANVGVDKPSDFTPLGAAEKQLEYLPGKHFPDPLPNFLVSLNLFWRLDIWRELRNARDAAGQRYAAAVQRRNYFVTRLVADVAENYFRLMALDNRLTTLERTIQLFEESYKTARFNMEAGRSNALPVQRFEAEIRRAQSERLIVRQDIIQAENRINFLANRFPQPVARASAGFFDLNIDTLGVGVPAQLLQFRPDVRQTERELAAAGLDILAARARFFPRLDLTAGVGYQAFSPKYLFWTPEALIYNAAADLVVPLINRRAIQADYSTANARQLQAVYNYQRTILNAFTEVVNRVTMVENYSRSVEIKKQQVAALEKSVTIAKQLFNTARGEYLDVLLAQRDFMEARMVLIGTKEQQLVAIVNTYQALGGGLLGCGCGDPAVAQPGWGLSRSQQGGTDPYGADQLPAPRKLPETPPAPGKQPGQLPGPKPAQPGQLPEPGKVPPPPGAKPESKT